MDLQDAGTLSRRRAGLGLLWYAVLALLGLLQPLAFWVSDVAGLTLFVFTLACAVAAYRDFGHAKNIGLLRAILYFAIFCNWFMFALSLPQHGIPDKAKEAEVKQNLHALQLAVERYGAHENHYPASISEVLASGDLPRLPYNPFANRRSAMYEALPDGLPHPGGFNYQREGNSYRLLAFGGPHTTGMDIDQDGKPDCVILVLENHIAPQQADIGSVATQ